VSYGSRRVRSANGLTELVRLLLGGDLHHGTDYRFDEIYMEEVVLGRVDYGHSVEASNAVDACIREGLVRQRNNRLYRGQWTTPLRC
jgi:hypothetical protein